MSKHKQLSYFPGVLNYSILVTILGVVWSDPADVIVKGEIGKVFEPWFISIIPLIMCCATVIAGYMKDMCVTIANKGLIVVDIVLFINTVNLLYTDNYRMFIVVSVLSSIFFVIFGRAYSMRMKDIISKLYPENYLEYQARAIRIEGVLKFVILSISLCVNILFVKEVSSGVVDYHALIYYSLFLGVISISYEIWFMKPLRYLSLRYNRYLKYKK